jgi:hypothetical protein
MKVMLALALCFPNRVVHFQSYIQLIQNCFMRLLIHIKAEGGRTVKFESDESSRWNPQSGEMYSERHEAPRGSTQRTIMVVSGTSWPMWWVVCWYSDGLGCRATLNWWRVCEPLTEFVDESLSAIYKYLHKLTDWIGKKRRDELVKNN